MSNISNTGLSHENIDVNIEDPLNKKRKVDENDQEDDALDEKEAQLYDRQIRLWGFEAQKRMQNAIVFVSGIRGLNAEAVKNIVLSGISVCIQDNNPLTHEDLSALYFSTAQEVGLKRSHAVRQRIQNLNSLAKVQIEDRELADISDVEFHKFDAVILSDCTDSEAIRIDEACRQYSKPFFWSGSSSNEGWFICDYGKEFEYKLDPPNKSIERSYYPSVKSILEARCIDFKTRFSPVSDVYVRSRLVAIFKGKFGRLPTPSDRDAVSAILASFMLQNGLEESINIDKICLSSWGLLMPVCSVVGGFLSQEVIKAVSLLGAPMKNVFVFSCEDSVGREFKAGEVTTVTISTGSQEPTVANQATNDISEIEII